jgi:hypothetical protein
LWQPDQINPLIDHFAAQIEPFIGADRDRWLNAPSDAGNYNGVNPSGGFANPGRISLAALVQDMKNFAFVGGNTWPDQPVGAGGRAAFLDSHQAANGEGAQIPLLPTISYAGVAGFPADGLTLRTTAFNDPQGAGTFRAVQWRLATWTDRASPEYDPTQPFKLEYNADWDSGPITTFTDTITVPVGAVEVGSTYRARVRMQDSTGRWSHWSLPIELTVSPPQSVTNLLAHLRISEVMFNPQGTQDYEFVELTNTGSEPLDLSQVRFGDGIEFSFAGSSVTSLAPGQYVVVTPNLAAFRSRYGDGPLVAGEYSQNISNGGERIELTFGANTVIQAFTFDDAWHPSADGQGYSLVPVDVTDSTGDGLGVAEAWRASLAIHGTPGSAESLPGDFDSSGAVGLTDLAILHANIGTGTGALASQGDMNGDGAVSRADVALWAQRFGQSYSTAPAATAGSAAAASAEAAAVPAPAGAPTATVEAAPGAAPASRLATPAATRLVAAPPLPRGDADWSLGRTAPGETRSGGVALDGADGVDSPLADAQPTAISRGGTTLRSRRTARPVSHAAVDAAIGELLSQSLTR